MAVNQTGKNQGVNTLNPARLDPGNPASVDPANTDPADEAKNAEIMPTNPDFNHPDSDAGA